MNKKFSTLMASLMLASAFSVSAQVGVPTAVDKYEDGKYYVLGDGTNALAVETTPGPKYGELKMIWQEDGSQSNWNLAGTRSALWKVTVVPGKAGDAPKYSFVNVATGMTLSVPTPESSENGKNIIGKDEDDGKTLIPLMISGGYMEWMNGNANAFSENENFYSYVNSTEVVYLICEANDKAPGKKDLYVKRGSYDQMVKDVKDELALTIKPFEAKSVVLTADDLNKELITNNDAPTEDSTFKLTFDQDVTENAAKNLFAETPLHAAKVYKYVNEANVDDFYYSLSDKPAKGYKSADDYGNYVRLYSKDNGYLMVDTALHTGSEAEKQLPKFTYVSDPDAKGDPIEGNNYSRLAESSHFKFAYEPTNDRVLIKVEKYAKRVANEDGTPVLVKGVDGNAAYTYWPTDKYALKGADNKYDSDAFENLSSNGSDAKFVENAYVRLVTLSNVRELTVAFDDEESTTGNYNNGNKYAEWAGADDLQIGMLTTVKIGQGLMSYQPTTIESGLYMIQFVKNAKRDNAAEGNYYVANLGGVFGYAEQAKNQVYDHIPAAQWYVKQEGSISSAPITISNREFDDPMIRVIELYTRIYRHSRLRMVLSSSAVALSTVIPLSLSRYLMQARLTRSWVTSMLTRRLLQLRHTYSTTCTVWLQALRLV